jgi:hypothetical protein
VKPLIAVFVSASIFTAAVTAGSPEKQASNRDQKVEERTVFITGSLIPKRIKVRRIGTTTVSPIRVIDRTEIDQAGRPTTPGALVNDPSVSVIGH